jgi:uncharacterized membrane protein/thiol-disulfide isomerase/thioredoxin
VASLSELSGTRKLLATVITALALVALAASSYLTWASWQQSTIAGCTGGSLLDCDEVLTSSWSKWLGIPVSLLGALNYAAILALVWPAALLGGWALTILLALAMSAAGAAVWFVGTQFFILDHFCLYCLVVHTCGVLTCIAAVLLMRSGVSEAGTEHMSHFFGASGPVETEPSGVSPFQPLIAAGIASVGLLALIVGQVFFAPSGMEIVEATPVVVEPAVEPVVEDSVNADSMPAEAPANPPAPAFSETGGSPDEKLIEPAEPETEPVVASDDTEQNPEAENKDDDFWNEIDSAPVAQAPRVFRLSSLPREIDAGANPVVGHPYAPVRFVEMMDYTCPHCRKLHPFVKKAVARYGDQLGFVIYHVPLSRKCNQLVVMDQAMHANACDYSRMAYSVWKLAPEKFAEYHDWLLDGKKVPPVYEAKKKAMELAGEAVLTNKEIEAEAKSRVATFAAQMEPLKVGLPILIFEGGIIRGMPESEDEWFQMLEQRLGLKPVATETN